MYRLNDNAPIHLPSYNTSLTYPTIINTSIINNLIKNTENELHMLL